MQIDELVQELHQIQSRKLRAMTYPIRPFFDGRELENLDSHKSVLIIGPRGVGKTTLLLQHCHRHNMLFFSADHPLVSHVSLWDISVSAFNQGFSGVGIDEVHYANQWSQHLKALYDSYPQKKIWASDSSSLILRKGLADLSRRFPRVDIPLLSFREYIQMQGNVEIEPIEPFNVFENPLIVNELSILDQVIPLFKTYLNSGLRPIFIEGSYSEKLANIIEKTIFSDVPLLLPQVKNQYLRVMNAIIGYLAQSPVPTLKIEALSNEWSIGKEKLYELLQVLEHVQLIHIVRHESDKKASGKGAKILLADPSFYALLKGNVGSMREAFVVAMAKAKKISVYAAKIEREGDFLIDGTMVEVGGKNKKMKQADWVLRDDIQSVSNRIVPLWSMGFIY